MDSWQYLFRSIPVDSPLEYGKHIARTTDSKMWTEFKLTNGKVLYYLDVNEPIDIKAIRFGIHDEDNYYVESNWIDPTEYDDNEQFRSEVEDAIACIDAEYMERWDDQ